jgi:putative ABC transport system ATP-binding protein
MTAVHEPAPSIGEARLAYDAVVRTVAVTKRYPRASKPAVSAVELDVAAGEMVGVMGPSGCGKSTLLHLLGGLDHATSGEIWLAGRRVDRLTEAQWAVARRREIGFVFQFFNLVSDLTVADNVELPALLAGVSAREARARRIELLDQLEVGAVANEVPAHLSGGQQQRVALARALVNRPALLLADEPTGNLDSAATRDVLHLLRQCHDEGQTIILVTHDPRVAGACDRVITMRDGTLVDDTTVAGSGRARELLANLLDIDT